MVAPRSTAWRAGMAARPSPRQRDRAVRLPPSVGSRLLGDAQTVAAYHVRVDRRGPAGRARAIRDAILQALAEGAGEKAVDQAIKHAMDAGMPGLQDQLF